MSLQIVLTELKAVTTLDKFAQKLLYLAGSSNVFVRNNLVFIGFCIFLGKPLINPCKHKVT